MKKSLRFCVLLALAAALLTVSAFADTGPKAQLKVLVKNAPEEPYYLDLLEKGDYQGHTYGSGDGDDRDLTIHSRPTHKLALGHMSCIRLAADAVLFPPGNAGADKLILSHGARYLCLPA